MRYPAGKVWIECVEAVGAILDINIVSTGIFILN
jgi:hypothetical protein